MQSLHSHSVISIPYELPVLSRPVTPPSYGLVFGEGKPGASIPFNKDVPFHILFLLKGSAQVKTGGKEEPIIQYEFIMLNSAQPIECICTHSSRYLLIGLEQTFPRSGEVKDEVIAKPDAEVNAEVATEPATKPSTAVGPTSIPPNLLFLFRYMLPTMPLNEKITHHFIPRIIHLMMRTYTHTTIT